MKCRWVQRRLSAYSDGALDAIDASRIEAHLNDCSACREACRAQEAVWMMLKIPSAPAPSAHFYLRLKSRMAAIDDAVPAWQERWLLPVLTVAVLIVGIFIGSFVGMQGVNTADWIAEEAVSPLELNTFEDFPEDSFGEVYYELAVRSEGGR